MHLECYCLSAVTVRICMFVSSRTNLHTCTLPLAGSRSPLVKYARGSHFGFSSKSQTRSCALRMPRYVTFTEIPDVLEQVGLYKSPGLDGLLNEVYLRLPHMFLPLLTDVFNHWFTQGAIPGSVSKGVITLWKKSGRHVWDGLDNYRPIIMLNTKWKILSRVWGG